MPSEKALRYAEIRAEHAARLAGRGIVLHCYECEMMVRHEQAEMVRLERTWTPQYAVDPSASVVFYPAQEEPFSALVRRVGTEATNRLRKVLEHPERCRLLCPAHLERAKAGWTMHREHLRRVYSNVGYDTPPHTVVAPNGRTVQVDEFGAGPQLGAGYRKLWTRYRAEWLAEPGTPPPYDGGGWVRL